MRAGLVGLVLLLWAGTAAAAEDPVYALYASGDYDGAVRAGEATHTAAGYAMAARALLGQEMLRDSPCLDCLKRAEQFARRAVAADPRFAWGQLWLAVSLGYEARITGIVRARLDDVPGQAHRALEAAIAADPDNPYAVSAMGGWNIAIVEGGGALAARLFYGATTRKALALFDRAVQVAADNVSVRYQIGLSLAGFDPEKYHDRIAAEFRAAIAAKPATVYEKAIQARAARLAALLTAHPGDDFAALVRKFEGYP